MVFLIVHVQYRRLPLWFQLPLHPRHPGRLPGRRRNEHPEWPSSSSKNNSTSGCPFGEGCHFLHYFPGGHQAVAKMSNLGGQAFAHPQGRMPTGSAVPDGHPTPTVKTKLCNKYNTAEGCKWGDKCHFAHGERELGKHTFINNSMPPHMGPRPTGHFPHRILYYRNRVMTDSFGVTVPEAFEAGAESKSKPCVRFFSTAGCRFGSNCHFIHDIPGGSQAVAETSIPSGPAPAPKIAESESFQTGVGSKLKPCTKFFSTSGCPFGEGCHFLHYFPGGHQAVAKMSNLGGQAFAHPQGRMPAGSAVPDGPLTPTVKTKLCNKYNTAEGCKWGDKCHFAHGERELGKHMFINKSMPPHMGPRPTGHFGPPAMPSPAMTIPAGFGASSTAKVSVDASLAGGIIGRGRVNTKQISRVTGAKLAIRDHESNEALKNIELEGTFDQINNASAMLRELFFRISGGANAPLPSENLAGGSHRAGGGG
ncbi:zinc finger CCCH domain-containing protein 14-like [Aegilops tauschii subsp. strangulata]